MSTPWTTVNMQAQPGHLARRLHQLAVALFTQEVGDLKLTPVQYAALHTICAEPGLDQKTLAGRIGYDTSTIAGVIDRLEARGLVARNASEFDRRVRLVTPTTDGLVLLQAVMAPMLRTQQRLLEPLSPAERKTFLRLVQVLLDANADLSHTPVRD